MLKITWNELSSTPLSHPSAVTCGVFDGVHRGHQALIQKTASRNGLSRVVVSFCENPRHVLHPGCAAFDITTLEEKSTLIENLGVDVLVLIEFSAEFRSLEGESFIRSLAQRTAMRYFAVGSDFKCGKDGLLRAGALAVLCRQMGITTEIMPPVLDGGAPVSSSRIRAALLAGDWPTVERLLGRPYPDAACAAISRNQPESAG
ncbi:MAG: FAD synthetase family protein [Spirochaetaceae bacterium]|jgi:riboflavin kinase/FMN adenylyltransferase|nr:FAD synthetase family protein [Spirochaetaceae bacterium]